MLNIAVVLGKLTKEPQVRPLPNGASVASFDLQVLQPGQAHETVPVALFSEEGDDIAGVLAIGEGVLVIGRVQRRFFRAGGATQSRTEVIAQQVLPIDPPWDALAALAAARVVVADAAEALLPEGSGGPLFGQYPEPLAT